MKRLENLANQNQNQSQSLDKFNWVLTPAKMFDFEKVGNLKDKKIVITGASRGIGLAIGLRAAQDGAKVAILAKTTEPHPNLPGTIYTAAEEINKAGGQGLAIKCDIRSEDSVKNSIDQVVEKFGGIDILINNASAISLTGTEQTSMKKFDLMHQVNTRGTYMVSKYCIPHLQKSKNPHILNLSPPLNLIEKYFAPHLAYTMAKFGMSLCVLGMAAEFKDDGIAVNALWPKTAIATSAVKNVLGGDKMMNASRKDTIMSDAAYVILTSCSKNTTGQYFFDDEVLSSTGVTDFDQYKINPLIKDSQLVPDFFL